jgi:hypothetical protein
MRSLSPYARTDITKSGYLDILNVIPVPAASNDILYTITTAYTYRPDLLAHDLYGTKDLWWIFAQRNPDTIKDPIFDFVAGTQIYLPQEQNLKQSIGL